LYLDVYNFYRYLSDTECPFDKQIFSIFGDKLLKPSKFAAPNGLDVLIAARVPTLTQSNRTNLQATRLCLAADLYAISR
jgi:hypothetical protein